MTADTSPEGGSTPTVHGDQTEGWPPPEMEHRLTRNDIARISARAYSVLARGSSTAAEIDLARDCHFLLRELQAQRKTTPGGVRVEERETGDAVPDGTARATGSNTKRRSDMTNGAMFEDNGIETYPEKVERIAKRIYDRMPDDGTKIDWIPGEHSMMQDLARHYAEAAILETSPQVGHAMAARRIEELKKVVKAEEDHGRDPFDVNFVHRDAAILLRALEKMKTQRDDVAKFADGLWNLLVHLNPHNLPGSLDAMWLSQLTHPRQTELSEFAAEWAEKARTEAEIECAAWRLSPLESPLAKIVEALQEAGSKNAHTPGAVR